MNFIHDDLDGYLPVGTLDLLSKCEDTIAGDKIKNAGVNPMSKKNKYNYCQKNPHTQRTNGTKYILHVTERERIDKRVKKTQAEIIYTLSKKVHL